MAYLKRIQGEKSCAHPEQRKKWLKREENYNSKGKDLLLRQKGCCGAVSKDFSATTMCLGKKYNLVG